MREGPRCLAPAMVFRREHPGAAFLVLHDCHTNAAVSHIYRGDGSLRGARACPRKHRAVVALAAMLHIAILGRAHQPSCFLPSCTR